MREVSRHCRSALALLRPLCYLAAMTAAGALLLSAPAQAGGGGALSGGATEITQLANNAELAAQVAQQAEMLARQAQQVQLQLEQLKSIATFGQGQWGDAEQALMQLDGIVRQGQGLSYAMQNLDQAFQALYPGYAASREFTRNYQGWSQGTLDAVRGALLSAGLQSNQFITENATMLTLKNLSDSAVGQTQAIQAGNMIAVQMVGQMQKLRQLHMAQLQAQSSYMAHTVNREAAGEAALDRYFRRTPAEGGGINLLEALQ